MVLNLGNYIDKHPGGRFSLEANIGRDVSKYFYGGYALENFAHDKVLPHTHSQDARRLVRKYAIGILDRKASNNKLKITSASPANYNGSIATIVFGPASWPYANQPLMFTNSNANNNALYNPLIAGKHYLVKTTAALPLEVRQGKSKVWADYQKESDIEETSGFWPSRIGIKRHYTEAFSMRPDVKEALVSLAFNKDAESAEKLVNAICKSNKDSIALTIKCYAGNEGLSNFIFEDLETKQQVFEVVGPMGKGLNPS